MRPVMTSPCSVCGVTLIHDHDPRTVLCGGCERLDRIAAQVVTVCSIPLAPPPTTEWRGRVPPPPPPPMRQPYRHPGSEVAGVVVWAAICIGLGFLMGWIARGGA